MITLTITCDFCGASKTYEGKGEDVFKTSRPEWLVVFGHDACHACEDKLSALVKAQFHVQREPEKGKGNA